MENISEKARRGRPRSMTAEVESAYRGMWQGKTRRTLQNRRYEVRTLAVLMPDERAPDAARFAYLCDPDGQLAGKPRTHRHVILAALGRVEDEALLVALAEHICRKRLTTNRAVALIQRVRNRQKSPSPERLADAILNAIEDHMIRYPSTPLVDVSSALDEVAEIVEGKAR